MRCVYVQQFFFVFRHSRFTRDVTLLTPGQCQVGIGTWRTKKTTTSNYLFTTVSPPLEVPPPRHHAAGWSAIFLTLSIPWRHLHDAPRDSKTTQHTQARYSAHHRHVIIITLQEAAIALYCGQAQRRAPFFKLPEETTTTTTFHLSDRKRPRFRN